MRGRALVEVLGAVRPWRLTEVRGIQPPVSRLLELIGLDLEPPYGVGQPAFPLVGPKVLAQARVTRSQSREVILTASEAMARLATTYAELAADRERRAAQGQARARQMQSLSDSARDFSARYRQRAPCSIKESTARPALDRPRAPQTPVVPVAEQAQVADGGQPESTAGSI